MDPEAGKIAKRIDGRPDYVRSACSLGELRRAPDFGAEIKSEPLAVASG